MAPPIPYGSSGEHTGFPGTLSIGHQALQLLLIELIRSADEFAGIMIVNGHGGNLQPLRTVQQQLTTGGAAQMRDIGLEGAGYAGGRRRSRSANVRG
ncbi:creatininase family protein [Nocardia sp. AB354]|uniref:creatininase family protein n=1 Tax=Nocardia sp. AB354 TaxID=3413283 RepID=UPI003C16F296